MPLAIGKLPPKLLDRLLRYRGARRREVLVGPGIGEDAAVISIGSRQLVLKSDPVTFVTAEIGWWVVQVNANDIAVMGAQPRWFQPTILLPPTTRPAAVIAIARDVHRACRSLGVAVTGGHTEVTDAVTRPIIAGDMHGVVLAQRVTSAGARVGDVLLMSKSAGIEGTAIIAAERAVELRRHFPTAILPAARRLRLRPGISVVTEALAAARHGATAMHDPTEGGMRAAIHELAHASRKRIVVDLERIPVRLETDRLCRHFGIDPLGLIGSGALLAAISSSRAASLLRKWKEDGVDGAMIGRVERGHGVEARRNGKREHFPWITQDEIVKALKA